MTTTDTQKITLRLIVEGETTVTVDRDEYEVAKKDGTVDLMLDTYISDVGTETTVVEPDGTCVLLADHGLVLPPPAPAYLVWSNTQGAWWGPDGRAYRHDVWKAGRYNEAEATKAIAGRTWANGKPPPEVMVLAPEHGRGPFAAAEIAGIPEQMRKLVDIETKRRMVERHAKVGA